MSREYDLQKIGEFLREKTIGIYNSVIGCKCMRIFNDDLQSNLDQYKFIVRIKFKFYYIYFFLKDPFSDSDKINESLCYIFIFDYGVIVFWNMTEIEEKSIISELKQFQLKSNIKIERDHINYEENKNDEEDLLNAKSYINTDHLILCGNTFEEKLAVSYALAQSSKLDYFEEDIDYSIDESRTLAEELAQKGYINLDHITLNKKIGKLYLKFLVMSRFFYLKIIKTFNQKF